MILFIIIIVPLFSAQFFIYSGNILDILRSIFFFSGYLVFPCLVMTRLSYKTTQRLFHRLMLMMALLVLGISILYLVAPNLVVFYGLSQSERYGNIRITPNIFQYITLLMFCYMVTSAFIIKQASNKIGYSIMAVIVGYYIIFGWLTRGVTIQILILSFYVYWIRSSLILPVKLLVTLGIVALFMIISLNIPERGPIVTFIELVTTPFEEAHGGYGTVQHRILGLYKYWSFFKDSWFIGVGDSDLTDENYNNPLYIIRNVHNLNLNDLGVLDTLFRYGFPAIIFVFIVLLNMKKRMGMLVQSPFTDKKTKIMAETIRLFVVMQLLTFPITKMFFLSKFSLFYGLLLYFSYSMITKEKIERSKQLNYIVK